MNIVDPKILRMDEPQSLAVALPDQSLAQMCAFVAVLESLDLIEDSNISDTALATLPESTRKTLLNELLNGMSELRSKRRVHTSARITLARLKNDARHALDIESIAQHTVTNHNATDQKG